MKFEPIKPAPPVASIAVTYGLLGACPVGINVKRNALIALLAPLQLILLAHGPSPVSHEALLLREGIAWLNHRKGSNLKE